MLYSMLMCSFIYIDICYTQGVLVEALRKGHWIILDELNLAPSEVLEALNRLLDSNRELRIAETQEIVKAHPRFRLFATQNPPGVYGGRKPLSRAFRNRFLELHVDDLPECEWEIILSQRCGLPPKHCKLLVNVLSSLRLRRQRSGLFNGKHGFISPRDLLRWANRAPQGIQAIADEGYVTHHQHVFINLYETVRRKHNFVLRAY
jgi:midasin